jgi:hypothetical protein
MIPLGLGDSLGWPDNPAALACWSETEDNPARPDGFYG